ncbi:P-loop containing nucleoside triphosphate hydrolase protein [Tuber brumale]|nr:P-loop containing nucleoside triphosphate hydrolase protein [Tuber brumale]
MAPLLIAISGPSSTGKTTLTRHLQAIFSPPSPECLHQDDFFHTDMEIPVSPQSGAQDWDCPDAIDWVRFARALHELKRTGRVVGVDSLEDLVEFDKSGGGVGAGVVEGCRGKVLRELGWGEGVEGGGGEGLAFVEGFLMFVEEHVMEVLDVKIFLRGRYDVAKRRREGRNVYATIEGYWKDPPGYWDEFVWPNYVKAHKHLFVNGDVEGDLDEEVISSQGIHSPGIDWSMSEILPWTVDLIIAEMKKRKQQQQ